LLLWPRPVLEHLRHVRVDTKSVAVTRILGARHLTQAVLSGVQPSPEVLAIGVWVDAVHAMTALGLAVTDRCRAWAGLIDTVVAGVWAVLGHRDLRHGMALPANHDCRRDRLARDVLAIAPGGRPLLRRADALQRDSPAKTVDIAGAGRGADPGPPPAIGARSTSVGR